MWEASYQHIAIAQKQALVQDPHLLAVRDLRQEEVQSRARLGPVTSLNPREIRTELMCNEFNKWEEFRKMGKGVLRYGSCTATNNWVSNKGGLSSGEWTNAIKASMNSMSTRGTGGRSIGNPHCRNLACNEKNIIDTFPHIQGSCPKTEFLRNNAYYKFCTSLVNLFRAKTSEVHEEVCCVVFDEGATKNRRADNIIVVDRRNGRGLIIDPTIRWETNDEQQDDNVYKEKRDIYLPCTPNLSRL
ncbi:uncharacterized protein LOC103308549 isoform X3 [Acyrthosiphon pisum]|uniref:Uncharacterized protein n=1 Tax=Acyrthosiphon pisum TaxID=7029 RepID=A0A8R2JUK4_ACYPI|nr:uncharacterized protein LOC103308549 isoform X3 [Acyrthosiphon pisum]XP_029346667.1 uncharacterized protein LOC103308549 isoform X3 [Acyrthosiphon pisum]